MGDASVYAIAELVQTAKLHPVLKIVGHIMSTERFTPTKISWTKMKTANQMRSQPQKMKTIKFEGGKLGV